ncbi:MAG TPA: enoyl-CoA hydratase-related protein [Chloroflexota bacterium]
MADDLVLTAYANGVAVITLNRPDSLNALSNDLLGAGVAALAAADMDPAVGAMVVTGGPRIFAAGADLKQLAAHLADGTALGFLQERIAFWDRLAALGKPVIAAVAGYALGAGCEMAMACDMIVAAETARFGQPEVNLGLLPGAGGTQRLTRAVGKTRAMELVLSGHMLSALEAERIGLINRVVPAELVVDEATSLAQEIAAKPPLAVRKAKAAILAAFEIPLGTGLQHEREALAALLETEDAREGIQAFLEKRQPTYHGR